MKHLKYFVFGIIFSIILIKVEAVSWFRIQEMFYFESFHMYGVLFSGIGVAMAGFFFVNTFLPGELKPKPLQPVANSLGGVVFGIGWGITGACSGPVYALLGYQIWPAGLILIGALAGTILYAYLRDKLPH